MTQGPRYEELETYTVGPEPRKRTGKSRKWGVQVFHNLRGAPMFSLGIHVDFHTPRLDIHLPLVTVCVGRIIWWDYPGRVDNIDGPERWTGHMDDCWCREQ